MPLLAADLAQIATAIVVAVIGFVVVIVVCVVLVALINAVLPARDRPREVGGDTPEATEAGDTVPPDGEGDREPAGAAAEGPEGSGAA